MTPEAIALLLSGLAISLELAVGALLLALGLGTLVALLRVSVLPQAFATMLPPLGNLAIALTKNTSVASSVLVPELMYQTQVVNARTFQTYATFGLAAIGYLALTIPLGRLVALAERRLNRYRRA